MVPVVVLTILFKNIAGANFKLIQAFNVFATGDYDSLSLWHANVVGFGAKYKQELATLKEMQRRRREDDWDELFERVKEEFKTSVGGPERIDLRAFPLSGAFSLTRISATEFEEQTRDSAYPQFVGGHYDCPVELDRRETAEAGR